MKRIDLTGAIGVKIIYPYRKIIIPIEQIREGWLVASDTGVQVVSIYANAKFAGGYRAAWFAGYDYYALCGNEIVETNLPSDLPPDALIKTGSEMDKAEFRALYNQATEDYEF